jgi:hypothetical protein
MNEYGVFNAHITSNPEAISGERVADVYNLSIKYLKEEKNYFELVFNNFGNGWYFIIDKEENDQELIDKFYQNYLDNQENSLLT